MIIRLTAKLAKKIKEVPLQPIHREVGPFDEWYAHLFTVDRVQYILTTNAHSLYSVVISGKGIRDSSDYLNALQSRLAEVLQSDGMEKIFSEKIAKGFLSVSFAKTNNRSILGSMNDMVLQAKIMVNHRVIWNQSEMTEFINDTPYQALETKWPKKELRGLIGE